MSNNQAPTPNPWVPVNEMSALPSEHIYWRVNLPDYAPSDRIAINAARLGALAMLGGYDTLRISSYAGDTTQVQVGVGSVGRDGAATYAQSVAVTRAETERTLLDDLEGDLESFDEYVPRHGEIQLNIAEIVRRIGEQDGTYRDPSIWSNELNEALTAGIRKATDESLLNAPPLKTLLTYALCTAIATAGGLVLWPSSDVGMDIARAVFDLGWYHLIARPFIPGLGPGGRTFRDRRWSIVPVYQLDRVIAVQALSRTLRLAKSIEPEATSR